MRCYHQWGPDKGRCAQCGVYRHICEQPDRHAGPHKDFYGCTLGTGGDNEASRVARGGETAPVLSRGDVTDAPKAPEKIP